jgi:predicted transcriptional regulator
MKMSRRPFLFWGFKSSQQMLEDRLGALEREVLSLVWRRGGDTSVRDACEELGSNVAYTTVMTTMDRLYKKRLLSRHKVGRAFVYRAAATREELEGAIAAELVQSLLQADGSEPLPVLSSLVDAVSDRDRALLDELERLVRAKRRAIDAARSVAEKSEHAPSRPASPAENAGNSKTAARVGRPLGARSQLLERAPRRRDR